MNSKHRLLSTLGLLQKKVGISNNYCGGEVRFLQFRFRHVNRPSSLISQNYLLPNLRRPTGGLDQCACYNRHHNAAIQSSAVISRWYATTPTPPPDAAPPETEQPEKKPSLYQRFKIMYRDYWYVLLPVHFVTSACWFGGFYYMASSGVDIVAMLEYLNVSEKLINPLRNGHATTGYLAISYALYKIFTPLRYTVTLGGTTLSINYLKKWGYIKPMPSKEKLKEMYEDKKEILKGKGQTIKDNMMQSFKPTESKKRP